MITAGQLRAARGLLGWSQADLAENAGIGLSTVKRMEASDGPIRGIADSIWKVQRALEAAGISFFEEQEKAVGVKLNLPVEYGSSEPDS